jgi:hypothetical protein
LSDCLSLSEVDRVARMNQVSVMLWEENTEKRIIESLRSIEARNTISCSGVSGSGVASSDLDLIRRAEVASRF